MADIVTIISWRPNDAFTIMPGIKSERVRPNMYNVMQTHTERLISGFLGLFFTLPPAFFPCYLHKEIALLLLDYDLQLQGGPN